MMESISPLPAPTNPVRTARIPAKSDRRSRDHDASEQDQRFADQFDQARDGSRADDELTDPPPDADSLSPIARRLQVLAQSRRSLPSAGNDTHIDVFA